MPVLQTKVRIAECSCCAFCYSFIYVRRFFFVVAMFVIICLKCDIMHSEKHVSFLLLVVNYASHCFSRTWLSLLTDSKIFNTVIEKNKSGEIRWTKLFRKTGNYS